MACMPHQMILGTLLSLGSAQHWNASATLPCMPHQMTLSTMSGASQLLCTTVFCSFEQHSHKGGSPDFKLGASLSSPSSAQYRLAAASQLSHTCSCWCRDL